MKSLFLVLFLVSASSFAGTDLSQPIPFDPDVKTGQLENGVRYFIRQNVKPEKRAEIRLAINAGSILEDEDQRGLAHFVEHMAFNGTKNFEKQELVDFIQSIGMQFGAHLNAYTGFDETVYTLQVPTDDPEVLKKAFLVISDWAHQITFDPEEVDKERGVVVSEWRSRLGAGNRMMEKQFPKLLYKSRYPERLPIGSKEILETASAETILRYYKDWYRPDLMAVSVVGDLDPAVAESLIKKNMGIIPAVEKGRERPTFEVPDHKETLFSIETDPELTRSLVQISYKHPAVTTKTLADWRMSMVRGLYQSMLNQRLYELTRQAEPPFIYGYAGMSNTVRSKNMFNQVAMVKEGAFEEGLTALLQEAERVKRHGFTAGELARRKLDMMAGMEKAYAERDKTESSSYVMSYIYHFLEQSPVPGIEASLAFYKEQLPGITLEEINKVAANWITLENRVILVSGPQKEGLTMPTEQDLLDIIAEVEKMEVKPYQDDTNEAPLVAKTPTPGKVVKTERIEEIDTNVWHLSNGIRVVLKKTDFKNDEISFSAFSPGGSSVLPDKDYVPAVTATSLVEESGLGAFNAIQLEKKLDGKIVSVGVSLGELSESLSGGASPKDLETMFQLIYLYFTAPKVSDEAFGSIKTRWKAFVENREANPAQVFGDQIQARLFDNHPRRRPFDLNMLTQMNAQRSLEIYKERFGDASDFTFVFVGNFEEAKLKTLVETWLGSLPSLKRGDQWKYIGNDYAKGKIDIKVNKGLEPKSQVRMIFTGDETYTRENSYAMRVMTEVLSIRLREVLREDMGGVYGVSVYGSITERPVERFNANVSFTCDPGEVDNLVGAIFAELEKIKKEGIEQSYLDKVRETQLRSYETSLKRNGYWLRRLNYAFNYGQDPRDILKFKDRVDTMNVEMVKEAIAKYFGSENYMFAVLAPQEGVETTN